MRSFIVLFLFFFHVSYASQNKSHIEINGNHFLSKANEGSPLRSDYFFFKGRYLMNYQFGDLYINGDFLGEYFIEGSHLKYYNAPELYLSYWHSFQSDFYTIKSLNFSIGRKRHSWNFADEYWEFGLWNPLNRWNPLHPTSNGLIGSFLSIQSFNWVLDLFVGGMYLPSSDAAVSFQNQNIVSRSRWSATIPNKVGFLPEKPLDIRFYEKTHAFLLDLFFQSSYILSFKTWLSKSNNLWMKWTVGYKPVNDIYVVTNTKNVLVVEDEQTAHIEQNITVLPVKQTIASAEWGWDYKNLSAIFSFTHASSKESIGPPENYSFLYDIGDFTYYSAFLRYNFSDTHYVQASYINSHFSTINKQESNFENASVSTTHYKILNGLGAHWYFKNKKESVQLSMKYAYSFDNDGGLLLTEGLFYLSKRLYVSLGVDILGAKQSSKHFLNTFKANDYVTWKIGYAF